MELPHTHIEASGLTGNSRAAGLPAGLGADWSFAHDLPCPRCRYNLRSLRKPVCPECGFAFRWQALLSIICPRCSTSLDEVDEHLCPHCFLTLDWTELFASADPRRRIDYEYTSRPGFRVAVQTWAVALNPWTFWRGKRLDSVPIEPRLKRLATQALMLMLAGLLFPLLLHALNWSLIELRDWLSLLILTAVPPATMIGGLSLLRNTWRRTGVSPLSVGRLQAYACASPALSGALLLIAASAAAAANHAVAYLFGGRFGGSSSALYFDPDFFFQYIVTGDLLWAWHPVEAWFNISLVATLLVLNLIWLDTFLLIGARRLLRLSVWRIIPIYLAVKVVTLLALAVLLFRAKLQAPWVRFLVYPEGPW